MAVSRNLDQLVNHVYEKLTRHRNAVFFGTGFAATGILLLAGCAASSGLEGQVVQASAPTTHAGGGEARHAFLGRRNARVGANLGALGGSLLNRDNAKPAVDFGISSLAPKDPNTNEVNLNDLPTAKLVNGCPADMASVDGKFCVDKFEGSLLEVLPSGEERAFSPYVTVNGENVRAVSVRGAIPQGYISGGQAAQACKNSGKRLCKPAEWKTACRGPENAQWGYGKDREVRRCNDHGRSPMGVIHGQQSADPHNWNNDRMNNPSLNQVEGTLAKTGDHEGCTNGYGVYDMVGNLHEWVDDRAGTFQGGYYLDTTQNGDGCGYRTDAHAFLYHDYSTGFRCCSDPE